MPKLRHPTLETPPQLVQAAFQDDFPNLLTSGNMPSGQVESAAALREPEWIEDVLSGNDAFKISGIPTDTNQQIRISINLNTPLDMSNDNLLGVVMGYPEPEALSVASNTAHRFFVSNNVATSGLPSGYSSTGNISSGQGKQRSQFYALHRDDFTIDSGDGVDWDQPIRCFVIEVRSNASSTGTLVAYFRSLWYGWRWKDGIIPGFLSVDDANETAFQEWRPRLLNNSMVGTFFIPSDLIGTSNTMTWDNVRQADREGFEIGNHFRDNTAADTLTLAEKEGQLLGARDAIRSEVRSSYEGKLLAAVQGQTDDEMPPLLQSTGFVGSRSSIAGTVKMTNGLFGSQGASPYNMRTINLSSTGAYDDEASVVAAVTDAIKYQCPISVFGHQFVNSPSTALQYNLAVLTDTIDGIAALDVAWVGFGAFVEGKQRPFPPAGALLRNRTDNGTGRLFIDGGGTRRFIAEGTWNGATVTVEVSRDAQSWTTAATFTASGTTEYQVAAGSYVRATLSSAGGSTDVTCRAAP